MSKSRAKGTAFETSLLPALKRLDSRVERSALKGGKDTGDFTVLTAIRWLPKNEGEIWRVVVSAKNCKTLSLSGWLADAEKMRRNAQADAAIVVHKKRGTTNPEDQYVTLTLGTLLKLLT